MISSLKRESQQRTRHAPYFSALLEIYDDGDSPWLLGQDAGPTLLDAHTVPFIARLLDARLKGDDLVPEKLREYAGRVMKRPEWDEVTRGRPTMWHVSFGHVHLMDRL
ncbi:unnamed protein product [Discula destructiva]